MVLLAALNSKYGQGVCAHSPFEDLVDGRFVSSEKCLFERKYLSSMSSVLVDK